MKTRYFCTLKGEVRYKCLGFDFYIASTNKIWKVLAVEIFSQVP